MKSLILKRSINVNTTHVDMKNPSINVFDV